MLLQDSLQDAAQLTTRSPCLPQTFDVVFPTKIKLPNCLVKPPMLMAPGEKDKEREKEESDGYAEKV